MLFYEINVFTFCNTRYFKFNIQIYLHDDTQSPILETNSLKSTLNQICRKHATQNIRSLLHIISCNFFFNFNYMSPLPFSCTLWSRQRKLNLSRSTVWCVAAGRLNTGPNICLDIERSVAPRKRDRFISSNLCLCKCHLNTLKWLVSL